MTGRRKYPSHAELAAPGDGRPAGTSWGLFPEGDRGAPSFIEASDVVTAARTVATGQVIGLDYPVDAFDPGMSVKREAPRHVIYSGHPCHRDDYLDGFYLQGSTQVDGLRHRRSDEVGFYNGVADEEVEPGTARIGIQLWADQPIVSRGVLVDVWEHSLSVGAPLDHASGAVIDFDLFTAAIAAQEVEVRPGDIVMIRTGWAEWFLGMSEEERRDHAKTRLSTGLRQQLEFPRWAWDNQLALLASDAFAVERLPVVPDSPFLESAPDDAGMMHQEFLAKLGIPLGELWRLDALAQALAKQGRRDCLLVVKPLNVVGATGSPANATAIL